MERLLHATQTQERWARALVDTFVSMQIRNAFLEDKMGRVYPNILTAYIAPSGLGVKTPALVAIRNLFTAMAPDLLAPARFTSSGMYSYLEKLEEKATLVLSDEFSDLAVKLETVGPYRDLGYFLSDIGDGHLQKVATKELGIRGGYDCYVSFAACGASNFVNHISDDNIQQGFYNRMNWIVEEGAPLSIPPDFFSEATFGWSKEFLGNVRQAASIWSMVHGGSVLDEDAKGYYQNRSSEVWLGEAETDLYIRSYAAKQAKTILKQAMIDAASRMSIDDEKRLVIEESDLVTATEHSIFNIAQFKKLLQLRGAAPTVRQLNERRERKSRKQSVIDCLDKVDPLTVERVLDYLDWDHTSASKGVVYKVFSQYEREGKLRKLEEGDTRKLDRAEEGTQGRPKEVYELVQTSP